MIEYFAGVGRIGRLSAATGKRAAGFDIDYGYPKVAEEPHSKTARGPSLMDLTTESGFAFLGVYVLSTTQQAFSGASL